MFLVLWKLVMENTIYIDNKIKQYKNCWQKYPNTYMDNVFKSNDAERIATNTYGK